MLLGYRFVALNSPSLPPPFVYTLLCLSHASYAAIAYTHVRHVPVVLRQMYLYNIPNQSIALYKKILCVCEVNLDVFI